MLWWIIYVGYRYINKLGIIKYLYIDNNKEEGLLDIL